MALLRLSRMAEADAEAIADFIARDNPRAASAFIGHVMERCYLLSATPLMGKDRSALYPGARSFPVGNYVIFYRVVPQGIEVLRILHGARDVTEL